MKSNHRSVVLLGSLIVMGYVAQRSLIGGSNDSLVGPSIDEQERQEYESIRDPRAREVLEDIKVFSALAVEAAHLVPETITVKGVVINAREFVMPVIHCIYNACEFGLSIVKFQEENQGTVEKNVQCLKFSDEILQRASDAKKSTLKRVLPKFGSFDLNDCKAIGCPNKRMCVAVLIMRVNALIKPLFENAIVKYIPETGQSQRGFILNIDHVIKQIADLVVSTETFKNYLQKNNKTEVVNTWLKRIDTVRQIILNVGQVMSGLLQATTFFAVAIEPRIIDYLDPTIKQKAEAVIQEAQLEPPLSDDALDDIYAQLED